MAKMNPKKIKVIFESNTWDFEYSKDLNEENIKRTLAPIVPEITTATSSKRYENNGETMIIEFQKELKYKG